MGTTRQEGRSLPYRMTNDLLSVFATRMYAWIYLIGPLKNPSF